MAATLNQIRTATDRAHEIIGIARKVAPNFTFRQHRAVREFTTAEAHFLQHQQALRLDDGADRTDGQRFNRARAKLSCALDHVFENFAEFMR